MDLPMIQPEETKEICIIGAGFSGLAALKTVLDSPQYNVGQWRVTTFESRDDIGGIWLPAPPTENPPLTPLYDSLTTNIPHPIMAHPDFPFPPSTPLFPLASTVKTYLNSYANHNRLRPHINLNTSVTSLDWDGSAWQVDISTGSTLRFDLVFVCSGHYRIPRYPDTPGLAEWLNSGRAMHSAWYRNPKDINNTDIVLVLGNGPSASDISSDLSRVAHTVIRSITNATLSSSRNIKIRPRIAQFSPSGLVTFVDGTTESGITRCILATGYKFSYPFLSSALLGTDTPPPPLVPAELHNSTYHIFPLARHIFPLQTSFPPTSLAFLGVFLIPFPLFEDQARAVLHGFANPSALDVTRESADIIARHEWLRSQFGDDKLAIAKAWHKPEPLDQYNYRNELNSFSHSASTSSPTQPNFNSGMNATTTFKIQEREKRFYLKKVLLRKAWILLEERGEAESWVRGVGEGGIHEWVDLMERLLKWGEENGLGEGVTSAVEKPKL